jgi:hypothetical protein
MRMAEPTTKTRRVTESAAHRMGTSATTPASKRARAADPDPEAPRELPAGLAGVRFTLLDGGHDVATLPVELVRPTAPDTPRERRAPGTGALRHRNVTVGQPAMASRTAWAALAMASSAPSAALRTRSRLSPNGPHTDPICGHVRHRVSVRSRSGEGLGNRIVRRACRRSARRRGCGGRPRRAPCIVSSVATKSSRNDWLRPAVFSAERRQEHALRADERLPGRLHR